MKPFLARWAGWIVAAVLLLLVALGWGGVYTVRSGPRAVGVFVVNRFTGHVTFRLARDTVVRPHRRR